MTYRTVLIFVDTTPAGLVRLRTARGLAQRFDGVLIGVGAIVLDSFIEVARPYLEAKGEAVLNWEIRSDLQRLRALFEAEVGTTPGAQFRESDAKPVDAMLRLACAADLIVADRHGGDAGLHPGVLVMEAGAPVLIAPGHAAPLQGRRIVVAWKNTREARRAVADALPLLKRAETVVVATVSEFGGPVDEGAEEVVQRLARHGVPAQVEQRGLSGGDIGDALIALAEEVGADLIVAGGYAHGRLKEWMFGGVTTSLLRSAPCHVLLSQ